MADTTKIKNDQVIRDNISSRALIGAQSEEIIKGLGGSQRRKDQYDARMTIERELKRGLVKGADPYDNTPGGSKVPKDKLMSLTNGAYTASLLEKILKASDNSQFQNSTLKFQEQTLNYMQSISADIKSLVEYLKPKQDQQQEDEDNELRMEMSNMAKALSGLDIENIAREIGKSIYSKMDSGGYGDLIKTMYQSMRDTIQGGEFSQMVKGMIQNTMLSQLPKEWQANIQQFRDDPVKLMQMQLNKIGRSDNAVIRDIFGSFVRKEKPNTALQEKKVDLTAKAMFDNKFYMSVTKVIPEQLYRIVAALEGHEMRVFDWESQKYATATEVWARAHKNNLASSPEALQRRVMDIFSYSFEQMAERPGSGNLKAMFQTDAEGKLIKDQLTGHVKFRNQRMKQLLTQIAKSGIPADELAMIRPELLLKELDMTWKSEAERGAILQDIYTVQSMLRTIEFEDRADLKEELSDLRSDIHFKNRDQTADFLTNEEMGIRERILYNDNLTADQKKDLLKALGQKGVHVWGNFGGSGSGSSGSGKGGSPIPPIFGPETTSDYAGISSFLNTATGKKLSDAELNDARGFLDYLTSGKMSRYDAKKPTPMSERDKYLDKLNSLYGMGVITEAEFNRMSQKNSKDELMGADSGIFADGGLKVEFAHKLYGILTDAGFTAEAKAAQLGISVQEAKARGYVSDAWELMKCIKVENGTASVDTNKLARYNMNYLSEEDLKWLEKLGRQRQRSVLGTGSIDQQISKSLSGIFGDPKIANKAGMALGGAAGLGVHKLLQSAGVMKDPRFGWLLGGVGAGLMTMERSRNFIDNIFGPAGDIKGQNGFTNKEIFMAKAMTKYLPMIGVGGKTAHAIIKATSAFGPLGKAFGMIAGPIIGFGMGKAASSLLEKGRDWLFNPDRDKKSKLGKLASFLKEIPGVKKLFALGDERTEDDVMVDSLKQTLSYFKAKDAELKAKGEPARYTKPIQALEQNIPQIEKLVSDIKAEMSRENSEDQSPRQSIIDAARKQIDKLLNDIDKAIGSEGKDIRTRYFDEQLDARDRQNRMRAAADADYNKIGEDEREKVAEIVGNYYAASDENKASFREYVSGEGDSYLDSISDQALRDDLETIIYRRSIGEDVGQDYEAWKLRFSRTDPEGYSNFLELVSAGERKNKALTDMENEIVKYLIDERHMGSNGETPEQIKEEARRMMISAMNNKSVGRRLKEIFGDTGAELLAKFQHKFSGLDSEDVAKEKRIREFFDALQYLKPENFNQGPTEADQEAGAGGRGTEPVKMKQMEKLKFASGESLGIAGCSVAAIINALVYMGLDAPEPETLIGIANKYLTKDGGITSDFFLEVAKNLGIKASIYNNKENTFTVDVFKQFKVGKDNGLICLLKNQFSAGYHYVTIKSVSGRKLVVDDPETKGLAQTTAADIVSRVVEIVSLKTVSQTSLSEEVSVDPSKSGTTLAAGTSRTTSIKQVAKDAIAGVASAAIGKISGGANKVVGKWNDLVEALKNAVFNVRIVDDFTLPLKMGDSEAALAISRMQAGAASASGTTRYVQAIKKYMQNKDVQNEMKEDDLVQEAILNGGLVAGGSTGAGGRGTIGNGKPGGTWGDAIVQDMGRLNKKMGLGNKFKQVIATGGLAAVAGLHGLASRLTIPMVTGAWGKAKAAYANLFGEIKDEDRVAKYDEEGNLIEKSRYRDISGAVRTVKDAVALGKGAVAIHGLIGKAGNKVIDLASKTKLGQTLSKVDSGMIGKILKLMKRVLLDLPDKVLQQIMKVPSLMRMMGGGGVVSSLANFLLDALTKICSFIAKTILPKVSAKIGAALAKAGQGGLLKKIISKIPGGMLLLALTGIVPAVINGWRKAGEYLNKKKDEEISFGDRVISIAAKVMYDCGPELIMGLFTTVNPWAALGADVGVAVLRSFFSFNDFIGLLRKGVKWIADPNGKYKDFSLASQDQAEKAEKDANKEISSTEDKEQTAAQTKADNAVKGTDVVAAGKDSKPQTSTSSQSSSTSTTPTKLNNSVGFFDMINGKPSPSTSGWGSPVNGIPFVTSAFGKRYVRDNPQASTNHMGVDIRGGLGSPVYAAKSGKVSTSSSTYGMVSINHSDGTQTKYLHLNRRLVNVGDDVTQGQLIGYIGKRGADGTENNRMGPHLHFEILKKGVHLDPFIEFGLSKDRLKLPGNGGTESNSAENIAYLEANQWLNMTAKRQVDNKNIKSTSKPPVTTNTEAGGPGVGSTLNNNNYNSYTSVNNSNSMQLERYVRSLDMKFTQMIDLLSKLVNISQENANNVLSDAMAPARI